MNWKQLTKEKKLKIAAGILALLLSFYLFNKLYKQEMQRLEYEQELDARMDSLAGS